MKGLGVESAASRRTMVAMLFAGLMFTAVSVQAQDAPAPAAQEAQAPAEDAFRIKTDAGIIIWYVDPAQTAAFETVWNAIRFKLSTSDKPELKELGDGLKVYKDTGEAGPQGVNYFFVADPASKVASYSPSPFLLFETGLFTHEEALALFQQLSGALKGYGTLHVAPIAVTPYTSPAPAADPAAPAPPAQ